jgi:hypothetical protein
MISTLLLLLTLAVTVVFIFMVLGLCFHLLIKVAGYLAKFTYLGLYYMESMKRFLRLNLPPPESRNRIIMDIAALFCTLACVAYITILVQGLPKSLALIGTGAVIPNFLFVLAFVGLGVVYGISARTQKDERHWLEKINALDLVPGSWKDVFARSRE